MSEVLVRVAHESDDRALAELDASSWPAALQVAPPAPEDEPFFTGWRHASDVLVAEIAQAVVGYARLGRHMAVASNDHVLHFHALVVAEAARGAGVGARLLGAAIDEAGRRGAAKLGLRVLSINETAIGLYTRCGFVEEGRLRGELRRPDGSYADDVWMALNLSPNR